MPDTAERTLRVLMRFEADKASQAAAVKSTEQLSQTVQDIRKEWDLNRETMKLTAEENAHLIAGSVTGAGQSEQAILAIGQAYDKEREAAQRASETAQAAAQREAAAQKAQAEAIAANRAAAMKAASQTRAIGRALSSVGREMILVGGAITAPILLAMNQYQKQFGAAEAGAQRWTDAMYRVEQANVRVGRVANAELVPVMEKVAGLAEDMAGLIEKNPDIIKAALAIGGSLVAVGTTLKLAAGVFQTIAAVQRVGAIMGVGQAAAGAAGAGAGGAVGAAGAGAAAGGLGLAPIIAAVIGQAGILAGVGRAAQGVSAQLFGAERVRENQQAVLDFVGKIPLVGTALEGVGAKYMNFIYGTNLVGSSVQKAADAITQSAQQIALTPQNIQRLRPGLAIYENFQKEAQAAAEQYTQQRTSIGAEADKRIADVMKNYNKGLAEQEKRARDFYGNEKQTEADYYKSRLEGAVKFGEESLKAERAHQRDLAQMSESHQMTMEQLLSRRDFAGAYWEQRRYEMERKNKEAEFATSQQQRNADFAKSVVDEDAKFAEQRTRRLAKFEEERKDQEAQLEASKKEQLAAIEETKTESLNKLQEQYDAETKKRTDQLDLELAAIGVYVGKSEKAWAAYYKNLEDQFKAFTASGGQTTGGGMLNIPGPSAPTTGPMAGAAGTGLTPQEKTLVDFVRGRAGGVPTMNNIANINLVVNGSASAQDKADFAAIARRVVIQSFKEAGVMP